MRTPAQKAADYRKTFPRKVNDRRLELIHKKYEGLAPGEKGRPFTGNPGWREEYAPRRHANLTDAERAELAECTRVVGEWMARSPWAAGRREVLARLEAEIDEIKTRHPEVP